MRPDELPLPPEVRAGLDLIGAEIRQMRLAADATQEELGELAGLDQSSISRVERGLMPSLSLYRYARLRMAAEGRFGPIRRRPRRRPGRRASRERSDRA
jgi:transcriptional regulator with XRE-family HTH domain